jgi:23S rRNA (guanine745-N1)-methyltransferase
MISARARFLNRDFYLGLSVAVSDLLMSALKSGPGEGDSGRCVVDVGCGEGYFTESLVPDPRVDIYGLDISKPAIVAACRRQRKLNLAVANATRLPLADNSFEAVTVLMAPFPEGAVRVLRQHGHLLRVSPGPRHLAEVKPYLFAVAREHQRAGLAYPGLTHRVAHRVTLEMILDADAISSLVAMTPIRYRSRLPVSGGTIPASLAVTADFWVDLFEKR